MLEGKLRECESAHGGAWSAEMAERARTVSALRATGKARVRLVDGSAVIRVTLTAHREGRTRSHTVTSGMDVASQLIQGFLMAIGTLHSSAIPQAAENAVSDILKEALKEDFARITSEVKEKSDELLADKQRVSEVRNAIADRRERRRLKEREDMVSQMTALLSSGWTREHLVEAMNEAVIRTVMRS